jgi:hypothetical protein
VHRVYNIIMYITYIHKFSVRYRGRVTEREREREREKEREKDRQRETMSGSEWESCDCCDVEPNRARYTRGAGDSVTFRKLCVLQNVSHSCPGTCSTCSGIIALDRENFRFPGVHSSTRSCTPAVG